MSRFFEWICMDHVEIASGPRTSRYVRNRSSLGPVIFTVGDCFNCALVEEDDVYTNPADDDAPWYDPAVLASADYLGIAPLKIEALPVLERRVSRLPRGGGTVGPLVTKPRILTVQGVMMAASPEGMAYGDRWLENVLAGQMCPEGLSEVEVLPACPENDLDIYEAGDSNLYIRRLIDAAVVDGPNKAPVSGITAECYVSQVSFQIAAGRSHLYSPEISCMDEEPLSNYDETPTCCQVSTNDWPGDAVANVTISTTTDATNIVLTGSPTFDEGGGATCPWTGSPPCWELTIPELPMDAILVVDSVRGEIRYRDPSLKQWRSGLRMVRWEGSLTFPEISPCSEFCICGSVGSGEALMTVDKVIREL